MSSEAKEFIVSTEYPGYVFLGWATGKFETDRGQKMPYYNMYVLSQVSGYTSEDYQAEGMKAEKRNTCPPRSGTVWNPVTGWGVSKHRVKGSQRVKKEQYLPDEASNSGLSGIQNGCSPEQKQQVLLEDFSIFWESTCFAVPVLGYSGCCKYTFQDRLRPDIPDIRLCSNILPPEQHLPFAECKRKMYHRIYKGIGECR